MQPFIKCKTAASKAAGSARFLAALERAATPRLQGRELIEFRFLIATS
jgi:hypothetical protein